LKHTALDRLQVRLNVILFILLLFIWASCLIQRIHTYIHTSG